MPNFDEFHKLAFSDLPDTCFTNEAAKQIQGTIWLSPRYHPDELASWLTIDALGDGNFSHNTLVLKSAVVMTLQFFGSNNHTEVGENSSGYWHFRMGGGDTLIQIGKNVTSNGVDCLINAGGTLQVGDDCMFSLCHINVGDSHAIFDLQTLAILNNVTHPKVIIREHVWVGLLASVLTDSDIGAGSVIATKSVVKGTYPAYALLAGIPARVKKTHVSWSRSYQGEDRQAVRDYLYQLDSLPATYQPPMK